jgi:hypothetical protein
MTGPPTAGATGTAEDLPAAHASTSRARGSVPRPLANRAFALIWLALLVSAMGDAFYRVALTLAVADQGAFGLAWLGLALALPTALVGVFAGVMIDRSRRVRLLIHTDLSRCLIVAVLGLLLLQQRPSLPAALTLAALLTFVGVVFTPALQAIMPELAGGDRDLLIAMDTWFLGAVSTVAVAGPAIAGILLQYVTPAVLVGIDALTFAFSALMILCARPALAHADRARSHPGNAQGGLQGVSDGLRFLMRHEVLGPCFRTIPLMDFAYAAIPFILPLLRPTQGEGAARYGAQIAALAIGRLGGMALVNRTGLKRHRGAVLRINFLAQGLAVLAFVTAGGGWIGLLPIALIGLPSGAAHIAMSSYVQLEVEPDLRGRVFTALISLVTWLAPFGPVLFVYVAGVASPHTALVAVAAVLIAGGIRLMWCRPLARVK